MALLFIAKLVTSCGLLYGYYHLFLRNKRFHRYNRFYLLVITLFSFIIPFIKIPVNVFGASQHPVGLIRTLKIITAGSWEEPVTIYAHQNQWSKWVSIQNGLFLIYIAGALTGLFILVRSLVYINGLKKKYACNAVDQLKIYNTTEPGTPFSFFRSIFWDKKISLENEQGRQIFRHEMFHVKEKHSADILLMEMFCCLAWFNPFFHLIKKELKAIHEFLADEYAISANNRYDYAELLVRHAISRKVPAIAHPFFHNQIKRRITMITQFSLVRRSSYSSRIMALPLLLILVSAFTVKLTTKSASVPFSHRAAKNIMVVIDAGHGGIFEGTHNTAGIKEKDINLAIAKKINAFAASYNVTVTLTRNSDALVGNAADLKEDLLNRIEITNASKPDLFISIHVNTSNKENTDSTGFQAYISGRRTDAKARQLASAVLTSLNDIYRIDGGVRQRQEGVLVLDKNTCPAILLECGFLNNPKDAAFITDAANQEKVARKILEGIVDYSNAQTIHPVVYTKTVAEKISSDTLSPQEMANINQNDIKSITVDAKKNYALISLKNGETKLANLEKLTAYFTEHPSKTPPADYTVKVNPEDTVPGKIFTKVEVEAGYPDWSSYLFKNLVYPQKAIDQKVQGTVVVQFIVDEKGKVSDVKALSGPALLKAESIRVVKESGSWTSALQNGKKVKAYKRQPITYKLERQG